MLSIGKIRMQRISFDKTRCAIHRIKIYLVDSDFHPLNNLT